MSEWIEWAKLGAGVLGAGFVATLAKLYHQRILAGKDTELRIKEAELARVRADLAKSEERLRHADQDASPDARDLARLREQLTERVERLAHAMDAQAASLYVPIYPAREDEGEFPRGFAFVAVYNADAAAAAAILRMKLVEAWTIVGECWSKGVAIGDNRLQANVRHVASYDQQSGFTPVHTLVAPLHARHRQVGVIQLFNKTVAGSQDVIDPEGFDAEDRRRLTELLEDGDGGLAAKADAFLSHRDCARALGLQGEIDLENAAVLYVDLTRSSSLFDELPLVDATRLIGRFTEHVYQRIGPYSAVIERFSGDGTLARFHYGGDHDSAAASPALRAVCAAAELLADFRDFKRKHWKSLAAEAADSVRLRVSITLGPLISTNIGPRQFQVPTVMGPCVNRAAKLIAHAPRDRDVLLVDDNVRKALLQADRGHAAALRDFADWSDPQAAQSASLRGHRYYEVGIDPFRLAAAQLRLEPRARAH